MKRILSVILASVLLLSLCACGGGSSAGETTGAADTFKAGFASVNVTPSQYGIPMDGHGNANQRLSTSITSYLYAIAVAMTDAAGNTAVIVSVDSCDVPENVCDDVRTWAKNQLNIPEENIAISAIHQHTCPVADNSKYRPELISGLKKAITEAIDDQAPAEMYTNKVQTEALNFVRRYWLNDGGFVTSSSNTGDKASGFKAYESEGDREMRLIKFARQDKKDIIMVNFQCHPHMSSSSTVTSIGSDWPGVMRDVVTEKLDANVIYISGAGANMSSASSNKVENVSTDFKHHGQRAAQFVIKAEDSYTKANTGTILCKEVTNTFSTDHSLDHLLESAKAVNEILETSGESAAKEALKNYPELTGLKQVSAIMQKAERGNTMDCTVSVITCGDVAFTVHPYEMFDSNGKELREGTVGNAEYAAEDQLDNPFSMTFIVAKGNGGFGYMPAKFAYPNGGYEPDNTKYAAGTGELLVGDCLNMLNELYAG